MIGYELAAERWTPAHSIEKLLLAVLSLLSAPNIESPANVDASKLLREDPAAFAARAERSVRRSLRLPES